MPDVDTFYSLEGSAAHELAEWVRDRGGDVGKYTEKDIRVKTSTGQAVGIRVTPQMRECVQSFVDYVNGIPGDDYNEERIYYTEYVQHGFGTMDAAKARARVAHLIDLKYGKGHQVFAENNTQLMLYALGFWLKYDWMYGLELFVLTIYQPRLQHVDSWTITVKELLAWAETDLRAGALRTADDFAEFKAGKWCTFCRIKKACSVRANAMDPASEFEPIVDADEFEDLDATDFLN